MSTIALKAEKKFGRYQAGEEFKVTSAEAKALVALRLATYLTCAIDASEVIKAEPEPDKKRRGRRPKIQE